MSYTTPDFSDAVISLLQAEGYTVCNGYEEVHDDDPLHDKFWFAWAHPSGLGDVETGPTCDTDLEAWEAALRHRLENSTITMHLGPPTMGEQPEVERKVGDYLLTIVHNPAPGQPAATLKGACELVREYSSLPKVDGLGQHEWTMDLYFRDDGDAFIEWDIPSLEETEQIGLWFDFDAAGKRTLRDYDGVMSLPAECVDLLREVGIVVPDEFDDRIERPEAA